MAQVIRSAEAHLDLLEIWEHIAENSEEAADRLLRSINERCERLAEFPRMGRSRDDLAPGLRNLVVGNYIVFYLPIENGIQIVRVLHGARDIDAIFLEAQESSE